VTSDYAFTGGGVIFKITSEGKFTNLRVFEGRKTVRPTTPFLLGEDGYLYGTFDGNLFKMKSDGNYTTTISYNGISGILPVAGLIRGRNGEFFGVAACGAKGGTILRMNSNGKFSTMCKIISTNESFQCPSGEIIEASDGNFYGINFSHRTIGGYVQNISTIFRLKSNGEYINIFEFIGARPNSALVQGKEGKIYGTTEPLLRINQGTIFRFSPDNH